MGNTMIIKAIYHDIEMNKHEATINSSFYHEIDSVQAAGKYGAIESTIPVSHTYKIDGNCVDRETFNGVINLFKGANSTADFDVSFDNLTHIDKPIKIIFEGEPTKEEKLREKLQQHIIKNYDLQTTSGRQELFNIIEDIIDRNRYNRMRISPLTNLCNNVTQKFMEHINSKENEEMPKIVNYKYNEEKGLTEITWSDKTITRVVAGDDTEKSAYVGFVSACAKKLFGNKSTYLNQFDKWTVKIPERECLAAEKKAAEDKEREEAKARKAAKKAERRAKREVELLAKEFADNYKHESVWEQAKKLAMKKYGVPADYFLDERCNCHYGCKEFDVMDEEENNISD